MTFLRLLPILLLAACAGQNTEPSYYLMRAGEHLQSRALVPSTAYSMGREKIAPYIDQPGLVLETSSGEVHVARNHLWAEPLFDSVRNKLQLEISAARGEDILPRGDTPTKTVIDIDIDQLHGTDDGNARLVAYWWLRDGGNLVAVHLFAQVVALTEDGYPALVGAYEELLTLLASDIASSMTAAMD